MDFTSLRALELAQFESAADGYRAAGDMANHAREALERQIIAHMRRDLKGEARDAAVGQLSQLAKNFHYIEVECGLISTSLNALASDLEGPKRRLDAAIAEAQAEKFTVNSDGSVSYPAAGEKVDGKLPDGGTAAGIPKVKPSGLSLDFTPEANDNARSIGDAAANFDPNPNHRKAWDYANRIAQAVYDATEADLLWAPKLRQLKADDDLTVSAYDWGNAEKDTSAVRAGAKDFLAHAKIPSKDSDPAEIAAWWKKRSKDEQEALISLYPASIGELDGLPAEARDTANRTVLAESQAEVSRKLQDFDRENPQPAKWEQKWDKHRQVPIQGEQQLTIAWQRWDKERSEIAGQLEGIEGLQDRLMRPSADLPEMYLLGFHPDANNGDGRVIIANGNPDKADHTAVYVPGSKTVLGNIGDELDKGEELWRESHRVAAGESVSTITWFDYDSPRTAEPFADGDILPEASSDEQAAKGAPALRQFLDGNAASHEAASGGRGHATLVGHSYGTTVMGDAAKYQPAYHESGSDPLPVDDVVTVASPGVQAKSPEDMGVDPQHFWAMAAPDDPVPLGGRLAGLGEDSIVPTDVEFGANIMTVDTEGHGGYWDRDENDEASQSLKNQANVIAGRFGDVALLAEAPE